MEKSNIILIGLPGAGKSTVGMALSKSLKMPFIDTDAIIRRREKRSLQEIINREGIHKFLAIEEDVIAALDIKNHIIATGGSAVYSQAAMQNLKSMGKCIYLQLGYEEMLKRIKNKKSRGIALGKNQNLRDLYSERIPMYENYADMIIHCSNKNFRSVVSEIRDRILEL